MDQLIRREEKLFLPLHESQLSVGMSAEGDGAEVKISVVKVLPRPRFLIGEARDREEPILMPFDPLGDLLEGGPDFGALLLGDSGRAKDSFLLGKRVLFRTITQAVIGMTLLLGIHEDPRSPFLEFRGEAAVVVMPVREKDIQAVHWNMEAVKSLFQHPEALRKAETRVDHEAPVP